MKQAALLTVSGKKTLVEGKEEEKREWKTGDDELGGQQIIAGSWPGEQWHTIISALAPSSAQKYLK